MSNKNLMLLVAAAAAYYFLFMKKKAPLQTVSPGTPDQPAQPVTFLQPQIQTESTTIVEQLKAFNEGLAQEQNRENQYQNFYVNQVNGVKRSGVPYTI
jgi:TolA-binding protein